MPCLLVIFALFIPRVLLFVLWAFTTMTARAFEGWFWPLLGFFFMPVTTLVYMAAMLNNDHHVSGWWIILLVVAIIWDLGSSGSATRTSSGSSN